MAVVILEAQRFDNVGLFLIIKTLGIVVVFQK